MTLKRTTNILRPLNTKRGLRAFYQTYLKHLAMFSEAIHLSLGDAISEGNLRRAEELCDEFYKLFPILYSEGSCGLNFHNVGFHLVRYVREWGPLFSSRRASEPPVCHQPHSQSVSSFCVYVCKHKSEAVS